MKNLLLILVMLITFTSCADPQYLCGKLERPYGLFNQEAKNPDLEYKVSLESVIWSIIGFEIIVVPVYLLGWKLYEPYKVEYQNLECE